MSAITRSARGEECQVRISGCCNEDTETTVLAHIGGAGMAMKHNDIEASYCCSTCHDIIDGRSLSSFSQTQIKLWHHEGCMRTRKILIDKGLITIECKQ